MNSLEAVFRFFECKGHTDEATTTFRLMDKIAVLQSEACRIHIKQVSLTISKLQTDHYVIVNVYNKQFMMLKIQPLK